MRETIQYYDHLFLDSARRANPMKRLRCSTTSHIMGVTIYSPNQVEMGIGKTSHQ